MKQRVIREFVSMKEEYFILNNKKLKLTSKNTVKTEYCKSTRFVDQNTEIIKIQYFKKVVRWN